MRRFTPAPGFEELAVPGPELAAGRSHEAELGLDGLAPAARDAD